MPTDSELVALCLSGRKEAFASIVDRYQGMVSGVLYCMCGDFSRSEDLAQETFVAAWKGLPQLREPAQLPAWLRGIARRTALNARRQDARQPAPVPLENAAQSAESAEGAPVERLIEREQQQVLWEALEQIPEQYREPMVLYYREHQSVTAVAIALEISEEAVRQRLARGRAMLREQVAEMVERTLRATAPNAAFTLAVLAALPAVGPSTALAAVGSAAAKGSTAAKGLSLVGWAAVWLGPAIAVFAGIRGAIQNLRAARSPREREFVKQWNRKMGAFILAFMLIFLLVALGMPYLANRGVAWLKSPNLYAAVQAVLWSGYFAVVLATSLRSRRRIRQIQIEDGTYRGESQIRVTTPRQWVQGMTLGAVAAFSWMVGMAALAGDWLSLAITLAVGLATWSACAMLILRGGLPRVRTAMMTFWICVVVFDGAMINLRVPQWIAVLEGRPVESIQSAMPAFGVNLLLAVIGLGVGVIFWVSTAPLARLDQASSTTEGPTPLL